MKDWREEIVDWLAQNERSQRWLAHKVNVSNEWISRILNGRDNPSEELLKRIAEVTGLELEVKDEAAK